MIRQSGETCVGRTDFGEEGTFPAAYVILDSQGSGQASPQVTPLQPSKKKSLGQIKDRVAKSVRSNASKAMSTAQVLAKSAKDVGGKGASFFILCARSLSP